MSELYDQRGGCVRSQGNEAAGNKGKRARPGASGTPERLLIDWNST
jgi:hypothetical protein